MNGSFSKIWILIIIVFLFGGIFAWRYWLVPEEKAKDETANWKTYINEEYKFEVKYPVGWFFNVYTPITQNDFLDIHLANRFDDSPQCKADFIGLEIQAGKPKDQNDNFISFVESKMAKDNDLGPRGSLEEIEIGGHEAFKVQNSGWDGCNGPGYFIDQDENHYIYIFTGTGEEVGNEGFKIINQIISTFKFIGELKIQTGKIDIDTNQVAELQKAVDAGSQPWRLDIFMSASADLPQYGFTQDDLKTLQCPHIASNWVVGKDITSLPCEISHDSKKYAVIVSQPQPGIGKIWMVSEIELAPFK